MNGVHDMGGMHGMGPIEPEPDEPVFHEPWEGRVLALRFRTDRWSLGRHLGNYRFGQERLPAADYLRMSYYERWFTVLVDRLLRGNLVTPAELESGRADSTRPRSELLSASAEEAVGAGRLDVEVVARYRLGERVRARNFNPVGHTRLPRYTRGKSGTVMRDHGVFDRQDTDTDGQKFGYRPQRVYSIRFAARELWGDSAAAHDAVYVDCWESYLEPA